MSAVNTPNTSTAPIREVMVAGPGYRKLGLLRETDLSGRGCRGNLSLDAASGGVRFMH